ncbi:unnamed protein product, partial [Ixodes hexagonus]
PATATAGHASATSTRSCTTARATAATASTAVTTPTAPTASAAGKTSTSALMDAVLPVAVTPWGPGCCSATARASVRANRAWKDSVATAALQTSTTSPSRAAG